MICSLKAFLQGIYREMVKIKEFILKTSGTSSKKEGKK
jgi:hypothetical protein